MPLFRIGSSWARFVFDSTPNCRKPAKLAQVRPRDSRCDPVIFRKCPGGHNSILRVHFPRGCFPDADWIVTLALPSLRSTLPQEGETHNFKTATLGSQNAVQPFSSVDAAATVQSFGLLYCLCVKDATVLPSPFPGMDPFLISLNNYLLRTKTRNLFME